MAFGIHRRYVCGTMAIAIMGAVPAAAQDDVAADREDMDALEAAVPKQKWYPDDYYDVRIAAEAQVAETPRDKKAFIAACPVGGMLCYDPFDPLPQRINPGESDPGVRRYGDIALDIARLRQELVLTGYPRAIYSGPLATYERTLVEAAAANDPRKAAAEAEAARNFAAAIEAVRKRKAPNLPRVLAYDEAAAVVQFVVRRAIGPSARSFPVGKKFTRDDRLVLRPGDRIDLLNAGKTRTLNGPGTFQAGSTDGNVPAIATPAPIRRSTGAVRGMGSSSGVFVQTSPPSGEVLLVSAFAFKICVRKKTDPWDRFACKWNEIETGVAKELAGRFVYQVRWPDGTVRKGTREITPADADIVTFKKVGS